MRHLVVDLAATSKNWALPPDGEAAIAAATPGGWRVTVVHAPTHADVDGRAQPSAEALAAVRDAEVYFGFGMSRQLFTSAPSLKWLQSAAAGVGALLYPELIASSVVVTNSAGIHAVPIAEHVLGGLIYLLRGFDVAVDQHCAGVWDKEPFVGGGGLVREVGESRVLIIGTGGIGGAVASRLTGLGAECVGMRRRPELGVPAGFARVFGQDRLDVELFGADVVILAAPLTADTRGVMSADRLDRLPKHAIVVNVGRGTLLDENALADRLEDGRLRGAVLDVFGEEPLAPDSRFWGMRQVLLTPHVSAVSPRRFWQRELALFFDNWERFRAGRPLRNVVDMQAGY